MFFHESLQSQFSFAVFKLFMRGSPVGRITGLAGLSFSLSVCPTRDSIILNTDEKQDGKSHRVFTRSTKRLALARVF